MGTLARINAFTFLLILSSGIILSSCASMMEDEQRSTNWQSPGRFSSDAIFSAALIAIAQGDVEMVSNDRQSGVITAKKVFMLPSISIPSEVPFTIRVRDVDGTSSITTTAFLKGLGTSSEYEKLVANFYENLFVELNISSADETAITRG